MSDAGFKRVNLWVPEQHVALLKELKSQLVHGDEHTFEALRDFVSCTYRAMLEDPRCDDIDRLVAIHALRELGVLPAESEASEDSTQQVAAR